MKTSRNHHKKKVEKKGCISHSSGVNLTKVETEVLYYLTKEFLTPNQVATRRKVSYQATNKTINRLKKKGIINNHFQMVEKNLCTIQPKNNPLRLHGQEFHLNILFKDQRYVEKQKASNLVYVDGNTVRLYKNSIEVYGTKAFFGDEVSKCFSGSLNYYTKIFKRLESDYDIILIKNRSQNIRMVNWEWGEVSNELARQCNEEAEKIRIYATEDGKLWFTIDNSFNLHEAETQHPETAKSDMQNIVKPFFNDMRDYKEKFNERLPTLSEMMVMIDGIAKMNQETAAGLNAVAKLVTMFLPSEKSNKYEERPPGVY